MVDEEAPRPPRIETAVEFWSGMRLETVLEGTCSDDMCAATGAAQLIISFLRI